MARGQIIMARGQFTRRHEAGLRSSLGARARACAGAYVARDGAVARARAGPWTRRAGRGRPGGGFARRAACVRSWLGKRWPMGIALCHLDVNIVRVAKAHGDGVVVNEKDAQHALDLVRANPQRVAHVVHAMLHEQVRVVAHVLVEDVVKRRAASSAAEDARVPHFAACSGRHQWVIPQWRAAVPRAKRPPCRRFARL